MWRITSLTAALLALVVLSGCAGGTSRAPVNAPSAPTASSPVASFTATEQTASPPLDVTTESAKEFIRRFERVGFAMQSTGDTAAFRSMTFRCAACLDFARTVEEIYRTGGSGHFTTSRVVGLRQVDATFGGTYVFDYTVILGPGEIRNASGRKTQTFTGGRSLFQIRIRRKSDRWVVTALGGRSR